MIDGHILLVGSVDLVKARHRNSGRVSLRVRNEINAELVALGWPEKAPFSHISLIIRYGETRLEPVQIDKITKRHNELPVAVQEDVSKIVAADKSETEIESVVRPCIVRAVNAVAEKYGLPQLYA